MFDWPVDDKGKPLALVTMGCSEKVGLPKYSNVDLGPASITRFVPDDNEAIAAALRENLELAEQVISEEREAILELVKQGQAEISQSAS
jgi:hypothetical protein